MLWLLDEAVGPARVRNGQSQRWHDDSGTPSLRSRCLHVCVYVHARGGGEGVSVCLCSPLSVSLVWGLWRIVLGCWAPLHIHAQRTVNMQWGGEGGTQ